jgi:hypothetical protein
MIYLQRMLEELKRSFKFYLFQCIFLEWNLRGRKILRLLLFYKNFYDFVKYYSYQFFKYVEFSNEIFLRAIF